MVVTKKVSEYAPPDPNFTPGPKNSHHKTIDPEFAKLEPAVSSMMAQWWEPSHSLAEFRGFWAANSPPPKGCPVEGEDIATELRRAEVRDGADVEVKIYKAKTPVAGAKPAIMMRYHGGGVVIGSHNVEHSENLLIAGKTNTVVVSVDYRMAPEYKFPTAINDCLDALKWARANAASLGADPEKIILNGSSAGGSLAAVVALMARDEGITGVVGQVLTFPVTCHPKFAPRDKYELLSYWQCREACIVDPVRMEWFLDAYMPEPSPDWRFSPLLAESLKGLPPALVLVAGFDILRDEAIAYAERLEAEGVQTDMKVYQGMPHCFYGFVDHPKAIDYFEKIIGFIKNLSG